MNKKIQKTPMVLQMETQEGGSACLAMILAYYKKWVPLEKVRLDCGVSRDGSNVEGICEAAQGYGLQIDTLRLTAEELSQKGCFPCILQWKDGLFTVCNGIKGNQVYLTDPAIGTITMSMSVFTGFYNGLCLSMSPGPEFQPGGKPPGILQFFQERVRTSSASLLLVVFTALMAVAAGVIIPSFNNMYTDQILTNSVQPHVVKGFLIVFGVVIIFQLLAQMFHILIICRVNGKMASTSNLKYLWHVLRMPLEFFSQRSIGDLTARQMENDLVSQTLVGVLAPLLIQLILLIFYLVVMLNYSLILTAVGLTVTLINLLIAWRIIRKSKDFVRVQMRDESQLTMTTLSGVDMIETIKASGAENGYFEQWSGFFASARKNKSRVNRLNRLTKPLPALLQQVSSVIILTLGTWLIIDNWITAGVFLGFQAMMNSMNNPVNKLLAASQQIQEMYAYMERINDVMKYPEQITEKLDAVSDEDLINSHKLSGDLELSHVFFGYSRMVPPLIQDFSLSIKKGSCVALVGETGSGKSTIAGLIAGLYEPWKGSITFDGIEHSDIPRAVFTGSVSAADQNVVLFEDSIENNIKMFDPTIQDFEMILACRDVGIHDSILRRKGGYKALLEEGGRDLSGGERQLLEIARALTQEPSILILDEATSALDARTELDVLRSVRARHITCIIVAHRLSAIRDCDEILVLKQGQIAERGTHEELMHLNGLYKQLFIS